MSKNKNKRRYSKNFKSKHPREVGKFYKHRDSKGGHPAQVFLAFPDDDEYLIIKFTHKGGKHKKKMKHFIDPDEDNLVVHQPGREKQYVHSKPIKATFDELEFRENYSKYRIHKEDSKLINKIKKNNAGR